MFQAVLRAVEAVSFLIRIRDYLYGSRSLCQQAKTLRKNLDSPVLCFRFNLLSLKTDINVPSVSNKQKNVGEKLTFCWHLESHKKRAGSGSVSLIQGYGYGSADPYQNVTNSGFISSIMNSYLKTCKKTI